MTVGNDVSQFQGQIDWNTYKNNSNFVIIRSTFGNGYYDSWFAHNRDEARRVNLPRGFYHYCYPEYNSAVDEAEWFSKALYDLQEGELLFLDFEENYNGDVVAWCKEFLDNVSNNFNGIKPLIYLDQSRAGLYDWTPLVNAGYGLWIADYTYDPNVYNAEIGKFPFAAFQQWENNETVPGINGYVDADEFFGTVEQFKAYGYKTPQPIPTPVPQPVPTPEPIPTVTGSTNPTPLPTITTSTTQPVVTVTTPPSPIIVVPPKVSWLRELIDKILKFFNL